MQSETQEKSGFLSRNFHIMKLISLSIGLPMFVNVPRLALISGAFGYMIWYMFFSIVIGIPVLYMELIMGQFTGLDTLDVWKVRPVLSHVGYVLIFWQFLILCHNHINATFVIHYMLISFNNPQPFYTCGPWAHINCNIMERNFTINDDCIRSGSKYPYCEHLFLTFPEVQYYLSITGRNENGLNIQWNMCIPSMIAGILLYLSCFKRRRSMEWFLGVSIIYPSIGFALLLLGSLLQKGILMYFYDAFDMDFIIYSDKFSLSNVLRMVIFTSAIGTGMIVNEGASCRFRAPCYANAVLTITANIAYHLISVCTVAMMTCPFAYEHNLSPQRIAYMPISFLYSRVPAMLREYDNYPFWLVITFSSYACVAVRNSCIIYYHLLEIFAKNFAIVEKYPGVVTFAVSIFLFLVTMPFLGNLMEYISTDYYRRATQLLPMLIIIFEGVIFILCYGLERFCEDVHFMQGIRPGNCMKFAWIVSNFALFYSYYVLLYSVLMRQDRLNNLGIYLSGLTTMYIVLLTIVKMSVSACKKQLGSSLRLSAAWKPRSELLQRSRAMFTAEAMTKEYLYRQYHLQARIRERQQAANPARIDCTL